MVFDLNRSVSLLRREIKNYEHRDGDRPLCAVVDNFSAAELVKTATVILNTRFDDDTGLHRQKYDSVRHMVLRHLTYFPVREMLTSLGELSDRDELSTLKRMVAEVAQFTDHIWYGVESDPLCFFALGDLTRYQYQIIAQPAYRKRSAKFPHLPRNEYLIELLGASLESIIEDCVVALAYELIAGHDGTFDELIELATMLTRVPAA